MREVQEVYRDTGCELAPSCLRCPYEVCQHDVPGGAAALRRRERWRALRAEVEAGVPVEVVCVQYGVSHKTVQRVKTGMVV